MIKPYYFIHDFYRTTTYIQTRASKWFIIHYWKYHALHGIEAGMALILNTVKPWDACIWGNEKTPVGEIRSNWGT